MTPTQLADELDIKPKALRRWLRSQWTGPGKGGTWDLSAEQIAITRRHFSAVASAPDPDDVVAIPAPLVPLDVDGLVEWSEWVPLAAALASAPRTPGVYMARDAQGTTVYVGMAGERHGKGVRGRLNIYRSGKAATSGLGEAAMDRALADPDWIRDRLAAVEAGNSERTKAWARLAVERADLQVRWSSTSDRATALALEHRIINALRADGLWNRR